MGPPCSPRWPLFGDEAADDSCDKKPLFAPVTTRRTAFPPPTVDDKTGSGVEMEDGEGEVAAAAREGCC